jgi:hypothetical protein
VPAYVEEPLVNVERMAFVAALVRDPVRDGERLAEVLDTALFAYGDELPPDVPHAALDLGDCMLALYPVPPDEATSRAVWGGAYERPRCIALALSVPEQSTAERVLDHAEVVVHHCASALQHAILVDGVPFPVVLTDQLLAGDPRATRADQEER